MYKNSTFGPHRDNFTFKCDNIDFGKIASTGQKRILALIVKLGQTTIVKNYNKFKPILLFDDVLLELDGKIRNKFLENIPEYEQAFFTFLPEEPYENYFINSRQIYYVNNGDIIENEKNI